MARTRQLRVEIVGDPRRIMRTFDSIEKSTGRLARGFGRLGGLAAAGLAGIAGGAVVAGLKSTIDAASDLNESMSKSQVVFGKSNKAVVAFARSAAKSLGQSRQQATEAAATFGNLFVAMRIGQKPAADMSIKIVRLASDLASFNNTNPAEALEALRAGLVGETEPLRRFGINLNDARLREEALRLGLVKTTKEVLPPAAKAQAAYSLIMKDSATAQGDFARTADGAANQQRIFKARIEDLKATLGQALLPAFNRVVKFINETFLPAIGKFWREHGPAFRDTVSEINQRAGVFFRQLKENLEPQLKRIKDAWDANKDSLRELISSLRGSQDEFATAEDTAKSFGDTLTKVIEFSGALARLLKRVEGHLNDTARGFQDAGHLIHTTFVRPLAVSIGTLVQRWAASFHAMVRVAATAAEAMHLPWARSLRKAEQDIGHFRSAFNRQMDALRDENVGVHVKGTIAMPGAPRGTALLIEKGLRRAAGGAIAGPGTGTSDSVPAMLSRGEHVWSAAEVAGAGGHAAMEAMRRHARGFAAGGAVALHQDLPSARGFGAASERMVDRIAASTARVFERNIVARMPMVFPPHVPGGYRVALDFLRALGIGVNVISTFRPGARTRASGSVSYHALNRAMDLTGDMRGAFNALAMTNPTELIFSHMPFYIAGGRRKPIGQLDPITFMDHLSHVHAAYDRGGWLPPGVSVAVNRTGRPERVLPPGEGGLTVNFYGPVFGDRRAITETVRQGLKEALRREGRGALAAQL